MKMTVIGAGSFVFGATVLKDAIERHRLNGCSLALVDLDEDLVKLMATLGRRMAEDLAVDCSITTHCNRLEALPGSDFVLLSACPQGQRRWQMDCSVLEDAGMPDQRRECGGLGGLSNSLRAIGLALDVCHDMKRLCPQAPLLAVTNPMPRVVTAVNRFTSVRAFGFCNAAFGGPIGYDKTGKLYVHNPVEYDAVVGQLGRKASSLDVVTAGLNHFAWLVCVKDRQTGLDCTSELITAIRQRTDEEAVILSSWLDTHGALAMSGTHHQGEYMPPDPRIIYHGNPPYHGSGDAGRKHRERLQAVASGKENWRTIFDEGSWEHPVDVAVALSGGAEAQVAMINLPNAGSVADLPDGRIVESPAIVRPGVIQGLGVGRLPGRAGELCRQVSAVHELVAEGAATGSREKLASAIAFDMAIPDKKKALIALDQLLNVHRDLLPRFHA